MGLHPAVLWRVDVGTVMRLFLVPALLARGGVSGLAQIINHYTGWPIGMMTLLGNLPIFLEGWRYPGGPRFALRTAFAVVLFSSFTDLLKYFLPTNGLTHDLALNALYGGVVSGTSGGGDILARILNHKWGISLARSYMMTNALIIFLAGISFSCENALYALALLYVSGLAAKTVSEDMTDQILHDMERGVTLLPAKGGFTSIEHTILYCVISRAEVHWLKALVCDIDPQAFMVIGVAYEALGEGFKSLADG
jgi:uncharacterized membrane-anchored protein YitT (DUF2179 family)